MLARHADGCRWLDAKMRRDGPKSIRLEREVDPVALRTAYGGDPLTDETVAYMCAPERRVPESFTVYFQPITWAGVPDVPITWLLNRADRVIPPDLQRTMMDRLPRAARIVETDAGHIPSVTHPELVAAVLNDAATGPVTRSD
jgi:pimeloyl-ACP methyl ester carboxylesterase